MAVASTGVLKIDTGGYEEDGLFESNPPINSINQSYSAAQNWGIGDNATAGGGGNGTTYTVRYQIEQQSAVLRQFSSPEELVADFLARGRSRAAAKKAAGSAIAATADESERRIASEAAKDVERVLAKLQQLERMPRPAQIEEIRRAYARRGARIIAEAGVDFRAEDASAKIPVKIVMD